MPMLPVPVPIMKRFDAILEKRDVAPIQRADYKKWLRYFLGTFVHRQVAEKKTDPVPAKAGRACWDTMVFLHHACLGIPLP